MRRRLPSLNALRAFEAAGRHESVSLAAQELGVTPGAVSRHITALEQDIGRKLFLRQTRGLALTDGGRRYLSALVTVFDQVGQATEDLRQTPRETKLIVSAYSSFSSEWLVPRLAGFRESYPEVTFSLVASHTPPVLERGAADIGTRIGAGLWPGLRADLLFDEIYVPVCSPRLLESGAPLERPEDIARHTVLYSETHAAFWNDWAQAAGIERIDLARGLQFENASLAYSAARSGQGIALGKRYMLVDDLASGRLVVPFGPMLSTQRSHYLISLSRRENEPAICAFRAWILDEARGTRQASAPILPNGTALRSDP